MNQSYWERTSFLEDVDYTVVGAGIVGLFAALTLKNNNPKANVLVLERSLLPNGASTKNAGFACFGSISELIVQLKKSSEKELRELVKKRWQGLQKLRTELGDENIGFKNFGGYEVFGNKDEKLWNESVNKIDYFNELLKGIVGENIYEIADENISSLGLSDVHHLIFNKYEAQIHSGKMMETLINKCYSAGVKIMFGYEVTSFSEELKLQVRPVHLSNETLSINTEKLLLCNNAFVNKLLPELDVVPGRGQVFITKPINNLKLKGTFHYDEGYYYFRNIDDRVLIGGGRNIDFKKEETTSFGITEEVKTEISRMLNEMILPNYKWEFDMEWSGIMAFGKELSPIIKEVSKNVYCAVRCNGMGVAMGSKIGEELAKLVSSD